MKTVLVAEEDYTYTMESTRCLRELSEKRGDQIDMISSESLEQAITDFNSAMPNLDLIISDYLIDYGGTFQPLIAHARESGYQGPIILYTNSNVLGESWVQDCQVTVVPKAGRKAQDFPAIVEAALYPVS